jgi:recombination protein RecA
MALTALEKSLNRVIKDYKDSFPDPQTVGHLEFFELPSPSLNYVFGGSGVAEGRIVELAGLESSGKTSLATLVAASIQKREKKNKILFLDFEYSYDLDHAANLGLDTSNAVKDPKNGKLIFVRPTVGEHAMDVVQELVQTGEIGLVIWDSISTTPTIDQVENDYGKKDFGNTAKLFSTGLRKLNPWLVRTETPMILISQLRDNQNAGMYGDPYSTMGGRAIPFYCSTRFRLSRSEDHLEDGEMVGIKIKIKNKKNKTGIPKRESTFDVYWDRGLDTYSEYIQFMIDLKLIKKAGAWYKSDELGFNLNGTTAVSDWFKQNNDKYVEYCKQVNKLIKEKNDLDKEREEKEKADGTFGQLEE